MGWGWGLALAEIRKCRRTKSKTNFKMRPGGAIGGGVGGGAAEATACCKVKKNCRKLLLISPSALHLFQRFVARAERLQELQQAETKQSQQYQTQDQDQDQNQDQNQLSKRQQQQAQTPAHPLSLSLCVCVFVCVWPSHCPKSSCFSS